MGCAGRSTLLLCAERALRRLHRLAPQAWGGPGGLRRLAQAPRGRPPWPPLPPFWMSTMASSSSSSSSSRGSLRISKRQRSLVTLLSQASTASYLSGSAKRSCVEFGCSKRVTAIPRFRGALSLRFWRASFLATPSAPLRLPHHTRHALWPRRLSARVSRWQGWWACPGFLRRACLPRPNAAIPLPPCPRAGGLAAAGSGRAVAWAGPSSLPPGGERARA